MIRVADELAGLTQDEAARRACQSQSPTEESSALQSPEQTRLCDHQGRKDHEVTAALPNLPWRREK